MYLVVMHVTDGFEVIDGVFAPVLMMSLVVKLKHLSRIVR
jgi:hypothetical protein